MDAARFTEQDRVEAQKARKAQTQVRVLVRKPKVKGIHHRNKEYSRRHGSKDT